MALPALQLRSGEPQEGAGEVIQFVAYPKSGTHYTRALLELAGQEVSRTHHLEHFDRPDLHVLRDIRALVVSSVCHFRLNAPSLTPDEIRPHVLEVADAMRGNWQGLGGWCWSHYVLTATEKAKHTTTYAQLVRDPVAALAPVAVLDGSERERLNRDVSRAPGDGAWATWRFRHGAPDGWRAVLTPEQERQILDWHSEGQLLVRELNAKAGIR